LANYNKGIKLSRGKYVWLVSADDFLRRPYVLERYVNLMEANPKIGFTFCPGVGVKNGKETGLIGYSSFGKIDRVVDGRIFLEKLLDYDLVLTVAAMARRECYEQISYFPINPRWAHVPIDLIWGGDWYLWCAFALRYAVGYFAEPMACYREHELAMSATFTEQKSQNCFLAEVAVPWMIKQQAERAGYRAVSQKCLRSLAALYANHIVGKEYRTSRSTITLEMFEESLCWNTTDKRERAWIRSRTFNDVGDIYFDRQDHARAKSFYRQALEQDPWMAKTQAKRLLLSGGKLGDLVRRRLRALRVSGLTSSGAERDAG
jgi:hypothetical protein